MIMHLKKELRSLHFFMKIPMKYHLENQSKIPS